MSNLQLEWTEDELLATDAIVEPLVAARVRCHGGFDADGALPLAADAVPHARDRLPGSGTTAEQFGTELLDVPLSTWPETYPNVAQAKFLVGAGVRGADRHDADPHRDGRGLRRDDPLRERR